MSSDARANLYFEEIELSATYKDRIKDIRKHFDIPKKGFDSGRIARMWLWRLEIEGTSDLFKRGSARYKKLVEYKEEKKKLIVDFAIPPSIEMLLDDKILCANGVALGGDDAYLGCSLIDPIEADNFFKKEDYWNAASAYAVIFIDKSATRTGVKKYIQENWSQIQEVLSRDDKAEFKRTRRKETRERNELVLEYYNMTREQLGAEKGEYKELAVMKMLEKEQGIHLSDSNIKRIWTQERKRRK